MLNSLGALKYESAIIGEAVFVAQAESTKGNSGKKRGVGE